MFGRIGMSEYNRRGACYRGVSYAPLSYYGSSYTDSLLKKNTSKEKIMEIEKIIEQANKELSLMDSWVEQLIDLAE